MYRSPGIPAAVAAIPMSDVLHALPIRGPLAILRGSGGRTLGYEGRIKSGARSRPLIRSGPASGRTALTLAVLRHVLDELGRRIRRTPGRAPLRPGRLRSRLLKGHVMALPVIDWTAHTRSKIAAIPWPPPMHMVTSAYRPPIRRSS